MTDAPAAPPPSLAEALGWIGFELDDASGKAVGRVEGVYSDAEGGAPVWLVVVTGRRRHVKAVAVPLRECAAMPGRVWTAQPRATMLDAPTIDPSRPLLREHEVTICGHYGVGERVGRHAEVVGRPEGTVTARPATQAI